MPLNCYRCLPPEEPMVLVVERSPHFPLCDKCGNAMVDIVDKIPYPVESGEVVEVMDPPPAKPTFEEVDAMDKNELRALGKKLGLGHYWNRNLDDLRLEIKEALQS